MLCMDVSNGRSQKLWWPQQVPGVRDGSLLKRVLEVRSQGNGLSLPPPELGFTESSLVHQVIHPMAFIWAPYYLLLRLLAISTMAG